MARTIAALKLNEVQKYLVLTGHIITPRLVIANEAWLSGLDDADREILEGAIAEAVVWQDAELESQEAALLGTLEEQGMTVIEGNQSLPISQRFIKLAQDLLKDEHHGV